MTDTLTKVKRKQRTVKNPEIVRSAALSLPLQEKVDLVRILQDSITEEVETIKAAAVQAEKIANGTK